MNDSALAAASDQVSAAQRGVPMIRAFFDEPTNTVSYVVHDPETRRAAIIDSVLDYDPASGRTSCASADAIIAYVAEQALGIDWLLETHAHADHLSAAPYLKQKLGGKIAIGEHIVTVQGVSESCSTLAVISSATVLISTSFGKTGITFKLAIWM